MAGGRPKVAKDVKGIACWKLLSTIQYRRSITFIQTKGNVKG
jgi:hypothetical protein